MNQREELIEVYYEDMTKNLGLSNVDKNLLAAVTKGLGPSIYLPDASKVSTSDKAELDRVKRRFCVRKLGVTDEQKIDSAIQKVADQLGRSNRHKYRAVFYYLLTKELNKESIYK